MGYGVEEGANGKRGEGLAGEKNVGTIQKIREDVPRKEKRSA